MKRRWATLGVGTSLALLLAGPAPAADSSAPAKPPAPANQIQQQRTFEFRFERVESDCQLGGNTAVTEVGVMEETAAGRALVFPNVIPERLFLVPVFAMGSLNEPFSAQAHVGYPAEGLGEIAFALSVTLTAPPGPAATLAGKLELRNTATLKPDLPPAAATRAAELAETNCRSRYRVSTRPIAAVRYNRQQSETLWRLVHDHTRATTAKDPDASLPPLVEGLTIPGKHHAAFLWRQARSWFLVGEQLALDNKQGRLTAFQHGMDAAKQALELAPNDGAAHLFYAANLGRYNTTHGTAKLIFGLDDVEESLLKALAGKSSYDLFGFFIQADTMNALAQFYRLVPDSFLAKMFLGVRGNIDKAVDYNRRSITYQHDRGDYLKELAISLLCKGKRDKDAAAIREGLTTMDTAIAAQTWAYDSPEIDREHMRSLRLHPDHACRYSRDNYEPDIGMGSFMELEANTP